MYLKICFKALFVLAAASCSLAFAHGDKYTEGRCDTRLAPSSLNGYTINYQILSSQLQAENGPYKGVIVSQYRQQKVTEQGFATLRDSADATREYAEGNYNYAPNGCDKARETAVLQLPNFARRVTQLTFTSKNAGVWERLDERGKLVLAGKFSLIKTDAQALAPVSTADFYHALIIKSTVSQLSPDSYPRAGLVVQSYKADGTMTFTGIGPGTLDSTGTYAFRRVSPNTAVEEAVQTSAFFSLPYTMVYTFETPLAGTWEQNFADGLILFSGTFDFFPAQ